MLSSTACRSPSVVSTASERSSTDGSTHRLPLSSYPDNALTLPPRASEGDRPSPCGRGPSRPPSADAPRGGADGAATAAPTAAPLRPGRFRHDPYASEPTSPATSARSAPYVSGGGGKSGLPRMGSSGMGGWMPSSSGPSSLNVSLDAASTTGSPATAGLGGMAAMYGPPPPMALYGGGGGFDGVGTLLPAQVEMHLSELSGFMGVQAATPQGRHMLTALLRQGTPDQVGRMLDELAPHVNALALDTHGCHVVRHLIEAIRTDTQLTLLVSYLSPSVVAHMASRSQYTRRALQALFETHQTGILDDVVAVLAAQVYPLGTTQQGCIAVMRCLEYGAPHQRSMIVDALLRPPNSLPPAIPTNPHALALDPYGNYVMQAVLRCADPTTMREVVERAFLGNLVALATNKYASNVLETLIRALDGCLTAMGVAPPRAAAAMRGGRGGCPSTSTSTDDDERPTGWGRGGPRAFCRGGGGGGGGAAHRTTTAPHVIPPPPPSPALPSAAAAAMQSPTARALVSLRRRIVAELGAPQNVGAMVFDGFGNFVLQGLLDTCLSGCEFAALAALVRPLLHTSPFGHKIESRMRICARRWS